MAKGTGAPPYGLWPIKINERRGAAPTCRVLSAVLSVIIYSLRHMHRVTRQHAARCMSKPSYDLCHIITHSDECGMDSRSSHLPMHGILSTTTAVSPVNDPTIKPYDEMLVVASLTPHVSAVSFSVTCHSLLRRLSEQARERAFAARSYGD